MVGRRLSMSGVASQRQQRTTHNLSTLEPDRALAEQNVLKAQ
jgi:hypothetical protein